MSRFTQFEETLPPFADNVSCPFHKYIAPGQSNFTVSVPKPFLTYFSPINQKVMKRNFFFGSLRLIPDFFNRDAQLYDLDTEQDLDTQTTNQYNLLHKISPFVFSSLATGNTEVAGWEYEIKSGVLEDNRIETFFKLVNQYTESAKPPGFLSAPFFFDWTTTYLEEKVEENKMDEYLEAFAELLYKESSEGISWASKYSNKLPPSQRKIPKANNWAFPTMAYTEPSVLATIRVRLAIAPNTKVLFSAKKMLDLLGFPAEKRTLYKYEFANPSNDSYLFFVAEVPPTLNMYNYGKITAAPIANVIITPVVNIRTSLREKQTNAPLYKYMKESLNQLAVRTNIDFNLEYNNVSETFKFIYPNNQSIKTVVYCDNDLSSRLGFGLKREITAEDTSKPVQNLTVKEGSKKSKILSFDTGHVVVTCFNTSSNLTSVSNNQYMASLLADNAGMLTISPCVGEPPSFVPPNFEQDGNNNVPLLCNLLKFNDVGDLVPFQWKTGAYISGILQGKL